MPQPNHSEDNSHDHQSGRGRGGRQHGITMQDLKKQTAMRLAQEQHQQRSMVSRNPHNYHMKTPHSQPPTTPNTQHQFQYQGNHNSTSNNYYDYYQGQQQQYGYRHPVNLQRSSMTGDDHAKRQSPQQFHQHHQQRQPKFHSPKEAPRVHRQSYQAPPPQPAPPPPQTAQNTQLSSQSHKWQMDMQSETSSIRSYEYDCNASSASNVELTEAGSTISAGSGTRYPQNQQNRGAVSSLAIAAAAVTVEAGPVSPLPKTLFATNSNSRQSRPQPDALSVISGSSKGSSKGGASHASSAIIAGVSLSRPQQQQHHGQTKQRKQHKSSLSQALSSEQHQHPAPPQNSPPKNCNRQEHQQQQQQCCNAILDSQCNSPTPYSQNQQQHPNQGNSQKQQPQQPSQQPPQQHHHRGNSNQLQQQQHGGNQKHNKLPHGLTVHELKEMTRARLAAEAAAVEKQDHIVVLRQQQQKQQPSITEGSSCTTLRQSSPDKSPVPDTYQLNRVPLDGVTAQQTRSVTPQSGTPLPRQSPHSWQRRHVLSTTSNPSYQSPVKHQHTTPTYQQTQQEQRQLGLDALETTSVASFNSTLGSESGHSSSFLGAGLQPLSNSEDAMSFSRSWSYPTGSSIRDTAETPQQPLPQPPQDTPKGALSSFFDLPCGVGGLGPRRRLGSSPPGYHLEVPHEDRPLTVTEELSLPMFDTPPSQQRWGGSGGVGSVNQCSMRSETEAPTSPSNLERYQRMAVYKDPRSLLLENQYEQQMRVTTVTSSNQNQDLVLPPLSSSAANETDLPNWVAESVLVTQHGPLLSSLNDGKSASSDNLCSLQHNRQRSLTDYSNVSAENLTLMNNSTDMVFRGGIATPNSIGNPQPIGVPQPSSGQDSLFSPSYKSASESGEDPPAAAGGGWGAALHPIGNSLADLLRLPSHFGSLLNLGQSSPAVPQLDDSNLCGDVSQHSEAETEPTLASHFNFISRIDPEVVRRESAEKSTIFSNFFSRTESTVTATSSSSVNLNSNTCANPSDNHGKGQDCARATSTEPSLSPQAQVPAPAAQNNSSSKPHRNNRSSNKKKRDKNRRKRDNEHSRASS